MKLNNKIFLIIFIILIGIYVNLIIHQVKFYHKAEKLFKENKVIWALDYYSYVILCYTPFSPLIEKAEKKIIEIGESLYKDEKLYKSLFAYEILRSSYYQVRSFYQPKSALIKNLNLKIAKIKTEISMNHLKKNKFSYNFYNFFPPIKTSIIMVLSFMLSLLFISLYIFNNKIQFLILFFLFWICWFVSLFF